MAAASLKGRRTAASAVAAAAVGLRRTTATTVSLGRPTATAATAVAVPRISACRGSDRQRGDACG